MVKGRIESVGREWEKEGKGCGTMRKTVQEKMERRMLGEKFGCILRDEQWLQGMINNISN